MRKTFLLIIVSLTVLYFNIKNINAKQLEMDYLNNPYYFRVWEGGNTDSGKITFYKLDGNIVYCVEPGVHISDDIYYESSINNLDISNEILQSIKLIGYYGYEYPGHSATNYHIATQALIWEKLRNINVSFWTDKNAAGSEINIESEKNEIINLVNKHYLKPTIDNNLILSKDTEYTFTDNNNVLENYEIINNNNLIVRKDNNKLIIKGDVGDYELTLKKIKYNNNASMLYISSNGVSQKLMKLGIEDDFIYKINIHIVGGKIKLKKLDSDSKDNKTIGTSSLKDAVYGIYDINNNLVDKIITNEFGEGEVSNLKIDKYIIKEITPSYGYELDTNNYEIQLSLDNLEQEITVYEKLKKVNITIIKTLEGDNSLLDGEKNISFEIYLKDNNMLYQIITTNDDGVANINLPYGTYLIHQINTNKGYLKGEDFEIIVNEEKDKIYKVVYDKRVGNLKIIKIDSKTNENLENAFIEVYNDNNLIYSNYTNKDGIIEINDLLLGKYTVIEKTAPEGYILNNKEYIIDINKNKIDYNLIIPNDKIEIEVPYTSLNGNKKIKLLGLFGFIIGLAFIILSKKKILT